MIDVHILTMPTDNPVWFEKCLSSLKKEPVSVYVCNGKEEDIGNARADAFLLGDNEYVSFVDPDDYVLPGGFSACVEQLRKRNSVAAYTQEIVVGFTGEIYKNPIVKDWVHHLIVFRRDIVIDNLQVWRDWHWGCSLSEGQVFVNHLKDKKHKISAIKKPYYVWRRHVESYTMRKRLNGYLD